MHIEYVSSDDYSIFINSNYIELDNYTNKDDIVKYVKDIIIKIQNILKLHGFYKLKVYVCERLGFFINIVKIDNINYSNDIDLRVIVFFNEDVYVGVEDYFLVNTINDVRYYNDKYYVKVDDVDNIFKLIEFGKFIYGEEVKMMLSNSIIVS